MMELNDEQLAEIERFGGLFFSIEDIAVIMNLDADQAKDEFQAEGSKFRLAIKKGQLLAEAAIRQKTIELAKDGHAPSVGVALGYINSFKMKNA